MSGSTHVPSESRRRQVGRGKKGEERRKVYRLQCETKRTSYFVRRAIALGHSLKVKARAYLPRRSRVTVPLPRATRKGKLCNDPFSWWDEESSLSDTECCLHA